MVAGPARRAAAGRTCGTPLTLETSASPAGLTARARPEARSESARQISAASKTPIETGRDSPLASRSCHDPQYQDACSSPPR